MHRWTNIYVLSFRYLLPFFLIIYLLKDIYKLEVVNIILHFYMKSQYDLVQIILMQ